VIGGSEVDAIPCGPFVIVVKTFVVAASGHRDKDMDRVRFGCKVQGALKPTLGPRDTEMISFRHSMDRVALCKRHAKNIFLDLFCFHHHATSRRHACGNRLSCP